MAKFQGYDFEQGSKYTYELMNEESITVVFTDVDEVTIPLGTEYTLGTIEGLPASAAGTYILLSPPSVSINEATGARTYTVTLEKKYWALKNFIIKFYTNYQANGENPAYAKREASWSLTAHIGTFAKIIKQNITEANVGITDVNVDGVGTGGAQALSFSSTSIIDAINTIADTWNTEWWVSGSTLYFGKCMNDTNTIADFDDFVESSEPVQGTVNPNLWYVFGSTKNIPYWYKKTVNTTGVTLTFDNYKHKLGAALALTTFGEEGTQSLVNEGEQTTFIEYGKKATTTAGAYVWIDFDGCTANYAKSEGFNGKVYAYIQYSGDNKEYVTMQRIKVSDITGDTTFTKTKTYFKTETGEVYLRMLIELQTDDDDEMGYINISPTFAPKVYAVVNDGLKLGTLPSSCFESEQLGDNVITSAVVQNRLMLDEPIDNTDGGMIREGMIVFEDIYPKSIHTVELLDTKEYFDEVELADGTKEKRSWRAYRMKAPSFLTVDDILSGKTLAVHFETGPLAGMEFDVSLTKEEYDDGVLEIIRNDKYGRSLPDATLYPQGTYALLNFDVSSGVGDIMEAAEATLLEEAQDYIETIEKTGENRDCTMRVDLDEAYEIGSAVTTSLLDYDHTRIVGMEIPLDIPYDHPKYTIGNSSDYSRFGELKTQVEGSTKDGTDYSGGTSIYVIRHNDMTIPTNDNVYSAKRADENYLSKNNDDSAKGFIAFAKGLASMGIIRSVGKVITLKSFESGDYKRLETGFYLGPEFDVEEGQKTESRLEVDNLYVRNAIQYSQLNIKRRTYIGGSLAVTCGSAEIIEAYSYAEAQARIAIIDEELPKIGSATTYETTRKQELNAERTKLAAIPSGTFRCWFKNEQDGIKINNDFVVGDMATKETLNLQENSYYWRKVTGVGADYIDLSATDCDTSRTSNDPQAGDVIVQLGHESNALRQNAIFIKADSSDAPAILTYHGISTYNLNDHEAILQKYDSESGTMKLTVYGDCYVGDKSQQNFIKFTNGDGLEVQANKIKLRSDEGSSASGGMIDIKDFVSNIKDTDGTQYTIWFEDHVPTNSNSPAIDWSDSEKAAHEGDILYYRAAGTAYRYIGGEWKEITDQDTVRALEKVKEKKRVFTDQPVPPYEVGDLWTNAYFEDSTHNYDGDLLKCRVSKIEGQTFSINDWSNAIFLTKSGFNQNNNEIKQWVEGKTKDGLASLKAELTNKIDNDVAEVEQKVTGEFNTIEEAVEDGITRINELKSTSVAAINTSAQQGAASVTATANTRKEEITTLTNNGKTEIQQKITDVSATLNQKVTDAGASATLAASYKSQTEKAASDGKAAIEKAVTDSRAELKTYADNASASASLSSSYSTTASTKASDAEKAKTAAETAKTAAETAATNAENSKKAAETIKTNVATIQTDVTSKHSAVISAAGTVASDKAAAEKAKSDALAAAEEAYENGESGGRAYAKAWVANGGAASAIMQYTNSQNKTFVDLVADDITLTGKVTFNSLNDVSNSSFYIKDGVLYAGFNNISNGYVVTGETSTKLEKGKITVETNNRGGGAITTITPGTVSVEGYYGSGPISSLTPTELTINGTTIKVVTSTSAMTDSDTIYILKS